MNTVQPLGTHDIAGSRTHPTTYRIRVCPRCYGVLYWTRRNQTEITCDNCDTKVIMMPFSHPINYARHKIRTNIFSLETLLFALWALFHLLDYKLQLRKLLVFTFVKVLSYL